MNKKKVQFIDGPNLNLLGQREPDIYGAMTLKDIHKSVQDYIQENNYNIDVSFFYT